MANKLVAVGTGVALHPDNMQIKGVLLTAAAADAALIITGSDTNDVITISAKAGMSASYTPNAVPMHFKGPVTTTLTGSGAVARVDF